MESGLWQADLSSAGSGPADICWKAFSIPSLNNNYGREVYNLNIKILQRIALLLASLPAIHPRPLVSTDAPDPKGCPLSWHAETRGPGAKPTACDRISRRLRGLFNTCQFLQNEIAKMSLSDAH